MVKKINKLPKDLIIICFLTLLVFFYCRSMFKGFLIRDSKESSVFKEENHLMQPKDIESILIHEDSLGYEVTNIEELRKMKKKSAQIKDFMESNYIVNNEDGYEFEIADSLVEVKIQQEKVSRSLISRQDKRIKRIVEEAYKNLGRPYIYGDIGVKGFDCSGLTYSLYLTQLGIELPRSSASLASVGTKINKADLIQGDILLFNTSGEGISHAGIYVGEGKMIHASSGKRKVVIEDLNSKYYSSRYVTARRILK